MCGIVAALRLLVAGMCDVCSMSASGSWGEFLDTHTREYMCMKIWCEYEDYEDLKELTLLQDLNERRVWAHKPDDGRTRSISARGRKNKSCSRSWQP